MYARSFASIFKEQYEPSSSRSASIDRLYQEPSFARAGAISTLQSRSATIIPLTRICIPNTPSTTWYGYMSFTIDIKRYHLLNKACMILNWVIITNYSFSDPPSFFGSRAGTGTHGMIHCKQGWNAGCSRRSRLHYLQLAEFWQSSS